MRTRSEKQFLIISFLAICMLWCPAAAQTGVNSPYSRYGLGLLSDHSTGMTKSMGGIGTGFRERNTLNLKNPASYSSVDTLTFLADMGFRLQNTNFEENGVRLNARNAGVEHMAMQFRILPRVGMTLAFVPFSKIGYSFSSSSDIRRDEDGAITSTGSYSGSGGVRQYMAGLGWRPTNWLSAGINASYFRGDFEHYISNTYSVSSVQSRTKTYSTDISALKLDFGIQGTIKLGQDNLVLGLTYSPKQNLESEATITDAHSTTTTQSIENAFSLPDCFSAGFSYKRKNCIFAADVSYEAWSKAKFFGNEGEGSDRISAAAGFSIQPDDMSKNLFKRTSYQAGVNLSQSYFKIGSSEGPWQFGVSAGFSMPITAVYNSMSYLNVSAEYVRTQPMSSGMITENCFRINVGLTFLERWFMKIMVE